MRVLVWFQSLHPGDFQWISFVYFGFYRLHNDKRSFVAYVGFGRLHTLPQLCFSLATFPEGTVIFVALEKFEDIYLVRGTGHLVNRSRRIEARALSKSHVFYDMESGELACEG